MGNSTKNKHFDPVCRPQAADQSIARPTVKGVSIDSPDTHLMDDGFSIKKNPDGWTVKVSIVDLPDLVAAYPDLEAAAREKGEEHRDEAGQLQRIFPYDFLIRRASFAENTLRPAVTFEINLDHALNVTGKKIYKSMFNNLMKMDTEQVVQMIRDKTDDLLLDWSSFAKRLDKKNNSSMAGLGDNIAGGHLADIQKTVASVEYVSKIQRKSADVIVHEVMRLANQVAADYMKENNLTAPFRDKHNGKVVSTSVSRDLKFDQACNIWAEEMIASLSAQLPSYARLTSPMRHYDDYLTLKILDRHLDGVTGDSPLCDESRVIANKFNSFNKPDNPELYIPTWERLHKKGAQVRPGQDRNSMVFKLHDICHKNHWQPPLIAEREISVDGRLMYFAVVGKKNFESYSCNVQAVSDNRGTARETAALRMIFRLNDTYPGVIPMEQFEKYRKPERIDTDDKPSGP